MLDEHRQIGASSEHLDQLASLIRRDRNHPCVFAWCIGNEEMKVQHTLIGIRLLRRMQELAHQFDPTRSVTYAMNCSWVENARLHDEADFRLDVYGANYVCRSLGDVSGQMYDDFHAAHPDWPLLATEAGGSMSWRGVYRREDLPPEVTHDPSAVWSNPERTGVLSAYGETATPWGYSIEQAWKDCAERDYLAGTFLWTGFDYRGETYPARWPAVVTGYGLMDLCGFPKDAFHYHRAWWRDEPTLHLLPHWHWPGREGEPIDVWCYANCAEVELHLNGRSLGKQAMPRLGHAAWSVPYEPGRLQAVGLDEHGQRAAAEIVETPGPAAALQLTPSRDAIQADGRDVVVVTVSCVDSEGRPIATADHHVRFELTGPAVILGVGNGDPCSHEPDKAVHRCLYKGLAQVLLRSTHKAGAVHLSAMSDSLSGCELDLQSEAATPRPWVASVDAADASVESADASEVDNAL